MKPCDIECSETPGLCTYYAVASLLVIILAVSLIWFPFVQLISELNTIIARALIYINNEFLGIKNSYFFDCLENLLVSPKFLLTISLCCMAYVLYLASSDFLISAACFISTLPNNKFINSLKECILEVIEMLLYWKGENINNKNQPSIRFESAK